MPAFNWTTTAKPLVRPSAAAPPPRATNRRSLDLVALSSRSLASSNGRSALPAPAAAQRALPLPLPSPARHADEQLRCAMPVDCHSSTPGAPPLTFGGPWAETTVASRRPRGQALGLTFEMEESGDLGGSGCSSPLCRSPQPSVRLYSHHPQPARSLFCGSSAQPTLRSPVRMGGILGSDDEGEEGAGPSLVELVPRRNGSPGREAGLAKRRAPWSSQPAGGFPTTSVLPARPRGTFGHEAPELRPYDLQQHLVRIGMQLSPLPSLADRPGNANQDGFGAGGGSLGDLGGPCDGSARAGWPLAGSTQVGPPSRPRPTPHAGRRAAPISPAPIGVGNHGLLFASTAIDDEHDPTDAPSSRAGSPHAAAPRPVASAATQLSRQDPALGLSLGSVGGAAGRLARSSPASQPEAPGAARPPSRVGSARSTKSGGSEGSSKSEAAAEAEARVELIRSEYGSFMPGDAPSAAPGGADAGTEASTPLSAQTVATCRTRSVRTQTTPSSGVDCGTQTDAPPHHGPASPAFTWLQTSSPRRRRAALAIIRKATTRRRRAHTTSTRRAIASHGTNAPSTTGTGNEFLDRANALGPSAPRAPPQPQAAERSAEPPRSFLRILGFPKLGDPPRPAAATNTQPGGGMPFGLSSASASAPALRSDRASRFFTTKLDFK